MKILEQIQNQIQSNETVSLLLRKKKAILITLILVLGMIAGLYLVKQQQILKSRAAGPKEIPIDNTTNGKIFPTDTLQLKIIIDKDAFEK